jgi:tetratricopeptide (TPR) repeat protein
VPIRWLAAACVALAAAWASAASAPEPDACAKLGALSPAQADALAASLADACAAQPGLSDEKRADALVQGGLVRAMLGDTAGAERAFKSALSLRPGDAGILIELAQQARDRPEEALAYARRAAESSAPARVRADAARLVGEIEADLGDDAAARASVARALALGGDDLEALRAMARLERAKPDAAADCARRALRAAQAAPLWCRAAAYRFAAQIFVDAKRYGEAMDSLGRALRLDPDNMRTLGMMIQVRRLSPNEPLPAAEGAPEEAAAGPAADGGLEALRARFAAALAGKRTAEAEEAARRFTAAAATAPTWQRYDAYRVGVDMWLALGDMDKARSTLRRLDDRDVQAVEKHRLWPKLYPVYAEPRHGRHGEGTWAEAVIELRRQLGDEAGIDATLARALELYPEDRGLLQLTADRKLAQGKPEEALPYGRRLIAAYDKTTEEDATRLVHEDGYYVAGQDAGRREWWSVLKDAGIFKGARRDYENGRRAARATMNEIELALALSRGRPREALAPADRLIADAAGEPAERAAAYRRKALVQGALGDAAGEEASLERALALEPADARTLSALVDAELALGRPRDALARVERLRAAAEKGLPSERAAAHRKTAWVQAALKDFAGAEASLRLALAAAPGDAETLRELVGAELALGRAPDALADAETLREAVANGTPAERADAGRREAQARQALKDFAGAEASLRRALAAAPGDAETLRALIDAELALGRAPDALADAARLREAVAGGTPAERADAERREALTRRRLADAAGEAASLARALALAPGDAATSAALAEAELAQGRPREALAQAARAKASAKDGSPELASAYRTAARAELALQDEAGARADLARALAISPRDAQTLGAAIDVALARGRASDALAYAARLREASKDGDPSQRAGAERATARVQRALKDEAGAEASLSRALEAAPEDRESLREAIECELALGRNERALELARRLEKLSEGGSPAERASALRGTARVQRALKDEAGAEESLSRALEAAPDDKDALREALECERALGRSARALELARRLTKLSESGSPAERAAALRAQARVERSAKDDAAAEASLTRALDAAPRDAAVLRELIELERDLGRDAQALVLARRLLDASGDAPDLAALWVAANAGGGAAAGRARMAAAVKLDAEAACHSPVFWTDRSRLPAAYFDACLGRFPDDAALYSDRGIARFASGRQAEAVADFQKAIALRPGLAEAHLSLATALLAQNRGAEALAALDEGLRQVKKGPVFDKMVELRASIAAGAGRKP